jgi:hypothetical protein
MWSVWHVIPSFYESQTFPSFSLPQIPR